MSDTINLIILAAGKGTRLGIDIAKPLCPIAGKKLVDYVIYSLADFSSQVSCDIDYSFVIGHEKESVKAHIAATHPSVSAQFAVQKEQLGTGHAVKVFFEKFPAAWKNKLTIVVCADTPLITADTFKTLYHEIISSNLDAVCASFMASNPRGYGRIEYKKSVEGFNIIEEKDASDEQRKIKEVNSGLYIFKTAHIQKHIESIDGENKSNEFYLTDLLQCGMNIKAKLFDGSKQFLGVNNLVQLEEAETALLDRKRKELMLSGVRFINASTSYIDPAVKISSGSVIHPNVFICGDSTIGHDVVIESGVVIKDSTIENNVTVKAYSYFEKVEIKSKAVIGPFARLREGTSVAKNCKIGNFVETKKSILEEGVKISHLSYVGDAKIGENTNIGCGFITCNYDGAQKHKTVIGKNSFIGSDCQMIAPVNIGDEVFIGSGSTINKDVPTGAFAIARQKQVNKDGMAKRFIKSK